MKVHIKKDKVEDSGFLGFGKKSWYDLRVHFELNEVEQEILNNNPDLLPHVLIEHTWDGISYNATVKNITSEKNFKERGGISFGRIATNAEMIRLENLVNEQAVALKDHLMALKSGGKTGSSVTEL